jgi:aspartate-semialdehyde dehydrogenase
VGSESLLGREVRDLVGDGDFPFDLRLVAAGEGETGIFTTAGDEPAFIGTLSAATLAGTSGLILAGTAEASRRAVEIAEGSIPAIDLTFAAEDSSDARLRAPSAEPPGFQPPAAGVHVVAHPAAIAQAMFLRRLQSRWPLRRSTVHAFAPASERGTAGIEELHQQTLSMFAFKSMPKKIFDAQLSFNLLARYGEEAAAAMEETELRIEHHLATLLSLPGEGAGAPMPSLKLVQAPVFHGYSFSAWVEFESRPGTEDLEAALGGGAIDVRGTDLEPPTNVGQAGQGGIAVGAIAPDRNHAQACWFWMVADNMRLTAENALEVARQVA